MFIKNLVLSADYCLRRAKSVCANESFIIRARLYKIHFVAKKAESTLEWAATVGFNGTTASSNEIFIFKEIKPTSRGNHRNLN